MNTRVDLAGVSVRNLALQLLSYQACTLPRISVGHEAHWSRHPIHRWYFITEGLPIGLVKRAVAQTPGPILDPFSGAGTVLAEAKLDSKSATGVDVNPFMCFASHVKTRTYETDKILPTLEQVMRNCVEWRGVNVGSNQLTRLKKYYTLSTLQKLQSLKASIRSISDVSLRNLFFLCFVAVAIKSSRLSRTPALRYKGEQSARFPVFRKFNERVFDALLDLGTNGRDSQELESDVIRGDSRSLGFLKNKYALVVTSPPYCNNVDFIRHSQLELLWSEFASGSSDLGRLRHAAITSCEAMAHASKDEGVLPLQVRRIVERVQRRSDRRYHRVIEQYFNGMASHFDAVFSVLRNGGTGIYVIGDSWFQDVYVPTHKILGASARGSGFRSVRTHWLRKRFTGRPHKHSLSEYIIELRK